MDDQGGAAVVVVDLTHSPASTTGAHGGRTERTGPFSAPELAAMCVDGSNAVVAKLPERTGPFGAPELAAMCRLKHDADVGRIDKGRVDGSNAVVAKALGCSASRVRDKLRSMGKDKLETAFVE